ncbi:MAG: hypothetical protein M1823_002219 [Watsoniomyces obsoletus]|nr:MAG: hypothetical protein M1823_002219 [Watsoniomyces obsoletus]
MFRPTRLPRTRLLQRCLYQSRHASTISTVKPQILEKPSRYNPPSHPTRTKQPPSAPRNYPGPRPDPSQKSSSRKRYPNSFPDEGSFMHWFLTTRWIHLCISLGTLCTLGAITFHWEFHRKSPYANMLPPASDLLWHPISFISTYIRVFKLDVEHTSAVTAQRRKKKVDDVVKRNEYRKAHGLSGGEGFGGWTTKEGIATSDELPTSQVSSIVAENVVKDVEGERKLDESDARQMITVDGKERRETAEEAKPRRRQRVYTDAEGNKRPLKMWLGIW